jgi:hypothetical protein
MLMVAGILVDLIRGIGVFGLRRAALKEKDRQDHVGGYLQKLAFPIFKHRGPEMATHEIRSVPDGGLPVGVLIGIMMSWLQTKRASPLT